MNYRKVAGWSFIALGATNCILAWFAHSTLDCGVLIFLLVGVLVARGGRISTVIALLMSCGQFVGGVAAAVSCCVHGVIDAGRWNATVEPAVGVWALLNMALLCQIRSPNVCPAATGDTSATAAPDPPRPFQYSLRSLFVLTFLVAMACWLGTRPLPPNDGWGGLGVIGLGKGRSVGYLFSVVGYHSGAPVAGYIWLKEAAGTFPMGWNRVEVESDGRDYRTLLVDGKPVQPAKDFQLFVNDSQDNLIRLTLSQQDARNVFGRGQDHRRVVKFWEDVVEPMLKKRQATEKK